VHWSSSESGEDSDEEDHADKGEGDQDEHQPQQPVDGLLGVLLQSLRLRLQLLKVQIGLTHRMAQRLVVLFDDVLRCQSVVLQVSGQVEHVLGQFLLQVVVVLQDGVQLCSRLTLIQRQTSSVP